MQTKAMTIGSIVHGAYGDYYEQFICLKEYKKRHPQHRLVLFFASEHRRSELAVFDLTFADGIYSEREITTVPVDRFYQFQIRDGELQQDIICKLPAEILAKFDHHLNIKPWSVLRTLDLHDPAVQLDMSNEGRARLPEVMRANNINPEVFDKRFTVGFLWRYRSGGSSVRTNLMPSEERVRREKSRLLTLLIEDYGAHVLVCGMNVRATDENRTRIDAKYTERKLDLPDKHATYLQGLSWGLELEILRRCDLCIVMPSGFSEALWMKRSGPTVLVDSPPHYLAKLVWNRLNLFEALSPREFFFQIMQPHTSLRVLRRMRQRKLLRRPRLANTALTDASQPQSALEVEGSSRQ